MQCWDKLPKSYQKILKSKLQERKQCVKTSGMHAMYSNYKKFADYSKVLGTILNVGNCFLRGKKIIYLQFN
jgi:hypothetical protein